MHASDPDHLLVFLFCCVFFFFLIRTFHQLRKISGILYLFPMTKYMRQRASIVFFVSQPLQATAVHNSDTNARILACLLKFSAGKKESEIASG